MKTVVGGNITTEEEATAESHQPHMLLPPLMPQDCMKKHVAAHLPVRVLSVEHYSEPEPRTLQNSLERNSVEKFGDCVTLSPVCQGHKG